MSLISVIMSVHNGYDCVGVAIESILNQSYDNLEFLIMDDCSEDNTDKILYKYQNLDNRIQVFQNNKKLGLTKSLNILATKSKGQFIARQDADDISFNNRLETQYNFLINSKNNACSTRAITIQKPKKIPGISYYLPFKLLIKMKNPVIHGSLMINRQVFKDLGYYDEDFYYSQDYKLVKDLIINNYKIKMINKVLYKLNTTNNISTNNAKEQKYYSDCVKKNKKPELKNSF